MHYSTIHILGPSGSGKTYLARKLNAITGIPDHDLDEIFWDNSDHDYTHRRDPAERERLLQTILGQNRWILEGVFYKWLRVPLKNAHVVLYLDTPYRLQVIRILKRFIQRKMKIIVHNKKETFRGLTSLLQWNAAYNHELRAFIHQLRATREVIIIKNEGDIDAFLHTLVHETK